MALPTAVNGQITDLVPDSDRTEEIAEDKRGVAEVPGIDPADPADPEGDHA
ncbi:MAG TPA: hypothetical protein VMM92_11255 [Thermoanaerobaculia bacterium]|nr:hypothetical protein [Thermoanaerobaculia bacterium]